jgi:hypothetical protein
MGPLELILMKMAINNMTGDNRKIMLKEIQNSLKDFQASAHELRGVFRNVMK